MSALNRGLAGCLIVASLWTVGCQAAPPIASPPLIPPATDGAFPPGESLASTLPEGAQFVTALSASRKLAYALPEQGDTTGVWQVEVGKPRQRVGELDGPIEGLQWSGDGDWLYYTERRKDAASPHRIGRIYRFDGRVDTEFQDVGPLRVVPSPRSGHVVLLRTAGASRLVQPVFTVGRSVLDPLTPQADWPTWSADGRRVAYTSTDDAPAGQVVLWASSGARQNGVRMATIAPVEGMFWQAGDRLAVWRMTRSNGHDTELMIHSYPTLGGETTEIRIPMTDPGTGQGYVHTAITATPDGSRLLMRRQSPDQSVLVSIAERRVVAQGPAMTFHSWMDGDRFLASQQDVQGPRYFLQSLPVNPAPPAPATPAMPGVPAQDPALTFSYEIKPQTSEDPLFEWVDLGGGMAFPLDPRHISVRLGQESDLPTFLAKHQATLVSQQTIGTANFYTVSVTPSASEDLTELQALGSQVGLRAHYIFHSRLAAVLFLRALRMQLDKRGGVLYATAIQPRISID